MIVAIQPQIKFLFISIMYRCLHPVGYKRNVYSCIELEPWNPIIYMIQRVSIMMVLFCIRTSYEDINQTMASTETCLVQPLDDGISSSLLVSIRRRSDQA